MINPTQHILHRATNHNIYNCLTSTAHERYQSTLALTGHNFYSVKFNEHCKLWDKRYAKMPDNYCEIGTKLPIHIPFDFAISNHKFGAYQVYAPLCQQMHIPLISLEHTCKMPWWDKNMMKQVNSMRGNINVFITDWSLKSWEWEDRGDTVVIKHGIDSELFKPDPNKNRQAHILSVKNDFIGRAQILGLDLYKKVTAGLKIRPIGDSPGFSKPAKDLNDLINEYQTSRIIINTSSLSPVPMNILEGMSCGCVPVSTNACAMPEFITDGYDGFLCNNEKEFRDRLQLLLVDTKLAEEMSKNARKTIIQKCSLDRFITEWNKVFNYVSL